MAGPKTGALVATNPEDLVDEGKPRSLKQLERVIESNLVKGAQLWRIAADALVEVKERKLWKIAKDENGEPYKNFVEYAEGRFKIKKTYAYDLVKAATQKPEALTEGEAREAIRAERSSGPSPLTVEQAVEKMTKAWQRFEDSTGDTRDRAIEDDAFVKAFDQAMKKMSGTFADFVKRFVTIEGTAEAVEPDVQQD